MAMRESLANRKRPSTTFPLRVEDDTKARADLAAAHTGGSPEVVAEAKAALEACYEVLVMTALAPADWEELVAQHPPTEQQKAAGKWCNMDTFWPALLAACVAGDESEADWAEYTHKGALTSGEVAGLHDAAYLLNQRVPEAWYPKDSMTTPS